MPAPTRDLDEVRRIVLEGLRGYRADVYLFGSWARGAADRVSDIDVAVMPNEPLPPEVLLGISESLESSEVLYPVDLVDLSTASNSLRQRVLQEGVRWNA